MGKAAFIMATINLDDLMEKAKELADAAGKKPASFMNSQNTNMSASACQTS